MPRLSLKNRGFTLVEIMAVVAITLILVAIVLPNFLRAKHNSNEFLAAKTLKSLSAALEMYKNDYGDYPATLPAAINCQPPYISNIDVITGYTAGEKVYAAGYFFNYTKPGDCRHTCTAVPKTLNITGTKQFIVDETGQVRELGEGR